MTRVDERLVAEIWERQAFDQTALDGLGLRVLFRGLPSDAGGPDYQDALLISAGRTAVAGDVEFHIRSSDWYAHGHDRDPQYRNVILHIVWEHDGRATHTVDGEIIPILTVGESPTINSVPAVSALQQHPCVAALALLEREQVFAAIREAGMTRFRERADRFSADCDASDRDQVLYASLFEALGYASNRQVFRLLAEAAPFAWLMSIPKEQRLPSLLDAAALGGPCEYAPPSRLPLGSWRLARLRPANHPLRRIAAVVEVLERLGPRPSERLDDIVLGSRRPASLRDLLVVPQLLGRGRADEIVVSALLPFAAAAGAAERAEALYSGYAAPPSTRWTRLMLTWLREAGHDLRIRSAVEHQGLHAQYHTRCRYERRSGCAICGA